MAFDDVLLARPSSLDHLTDRAVVFLQEALAETNRGIANNLRVAIGKQVAVPAMRRNEALAYGADSPL